MSGLGNVTILPTEILLDIFSHLSLKDLLNKRLVSQQWKQIIDKYLERENIWKKFCEEEFPLVYLTAKYKAAAGMQWYQLYRSLVVWEKVSSAAVTINEFARSSTWHDGINDFNILSDGLIGVHTRGSISYYDIETLELATQCSPVNGNYAKYCEKNNVIVVKGFNNDLYVVRRVMYNNRFTTNKLFYDVQSYIMVEQYVYFFTTPMMIGCVNLDDEELNGKTICHFRDQDIMCIGYAQDQLYILTYQRKIYAWKDDLKLLHTLDTSTNILDLLKKYNLIDGMDWSVFSSWLLMLNQDTNIIPHPFDIATIYVYGDIVFVGLKQGSLQVYLSPYSNGELDIFNSSPVHDINLMALPQCRDTEGIGPVFKIDVMEFGYGHTVIAATLNKLFVIDFTHNFTKCYYNPSKPLPRN